MHFIPSLSYDIMRYIPIDEPNENLKCRYLSENYNYPLRAFITAISHGQIDAMMALSPFVRNINGLLSGGM